LSYLDHSPAIVKPNENWQANTDKERKKRMAQEAHLITKAKTLQPSGIRLSQSPFLLD